MYCEMITMITTIGLVNIYHHVKLQFLFSCDETVELTLLATFQTQITVLLTIVTMLSITCSTYLGLIYLITGKNLAILFSVWPCSWQRHIACR